MFKARILRSLACLALAASVSSAVHAAEGLTGPDEASRPATEPAQTARPGDATVPRTSPEAPTTYPFWTKYAYFVPSRFGDLPGWNDDDLADAWKAFRQSCSALASRVAWSGPCGRSRAVNARDGNAIRHFLEREFSLYEIRNTDRSAGGVITGYYEPLLHGSRQYGPGYPYPVYGVPDDLLYLDSRSIPTTAGASVLARVEGRKVVPVCVEQQGGDSCAAPYRLDLGDARPDIRDKRLRVRIDGNRVVPYYTRAEIERGALSTAGVLLWVDNIAALYSMQVQGSGKVRMPDGQIVRLAFAEQNGHPFTPPVRIARQRASSRPSAILTRGIAIPLSADDDDLDAADSPEADAPPPPAVRGLGPVADSDSVSRRFAKKDGDDENLPPEVARMVELLLKGTGTAGPQQVPVPATANAAAPSSKRPPVEPAPVVAKPVDNAVAKPVDNAVAKPVDSAVAKWTGMDRTSSFSSDPSYVFFRQIPDSDAGPLGALGVPLTAGRSLAVDPRTTPLGSPVFISTEGPSDTGRLNRLMLAQDTGGAIRGAVRADYFWGFGPGAGDRASRMKENGRMWLLLPKDLRIAAAAAAFATRGVGGPGPAAAECLVPDPELCVE